MGKKLQRNSIFVIIIAAILLSLPAMVNYDSYILSLLIVTGITTVLVSSLRLVFTAGVYHIGQAAFYAMGAYLLHFFILLGGLSFWAALLAAGIASALIAWGLSYAILRVKGVYFALLSIAFVEVVRLTIINVIGAEAVVVSTPPPNAIIIPHLFTIDFASRVDFYYLVLGLTAITLFVLYRIEKSRLGLSLKFIASNYDLAESIGINTVKYQAFTLTVCSFFAGIIGGFFASYNTVISPGAFSVWYSIIIVIIMMAGGIDSFWGPPLGAIVLTILPTFIPSGAPEKIFYGVLIMIILFFLPKGLVSLAAVLKIKGGRKMSQNPLLD